MNLTLKKIQCMHSVYMLCARGWQVLSDQSELLRFFQRESWVPTPPSGQLYLPNASLPSSNQKNLFSSEHTACNIHKSRVCFDPDSKTFIFKLELGCCPAMLFPLHHALRFSSAACLGAAGPAARGTWRDGSCWARSLPLPPFLLLLSFWNSNWMQFSAHLSQNILLLSFSGS